MWHKEIKTGTMGNFKGHLLPGAMFVCLGSWLILQTWRKYFKTLLMSEKSHNNSNKIQSEALYSTFICGMVNLQALLIVGGTGFGIVAVFFIDSEISIKNIQHAVMYTFFMMFGLLGLCKGIVYLLLFFLGGITSNFQSINQVTIQLSHVRC